MTDSFSMNFLAHQIRKSMIFTWDRDSYLTHVISPRRCAENSCVNIMSMLSHPGVVQKIHT